MSEDKIPTACTNCGQRMKIKRAHLGKKVRCPVCKEAFAVSEVPLDAAKPQPTDPEAAERRKRELAAGGAVSPVLADGAAGGEAEAGADAAADDLKPVWDKPPTDHADAEVATLDEKPVPKSITVHRPAERRTTDPLGLGKQSEEAAAAAAATGAAAAQASDGVPAAAAGGPVDAGATPDEDGYVEPSKEMLQTWWNKPGGQPPGEARSADQIVAGAKGDAPAGGEDEQLLGFGEDQAAAAAVADAPAIVEDVPTQSQDAPAKDPWLQSAAFMPAVSNPAAQAAAGASFTSQDDSGHAAAPVAPPVAAAPAAHTAMPEPPPMESSAPAEYAPVPTGAEAGHAVAAAAGGRGPMRRSEEERWLTVGDEGRPIPAVHAIQASRRFADQIAQYETPIGEYDLGRCGLLAPEHAYVLVTDHRVLVQRKRSYLFGLMPGADLWDGEYPLWSPDLVNARVYKPSMSRVVLVLLFMLLVAAGGFWKTMVYEQEHARVVAAEQGTDPDSAAAAIDVMYMVDHPSHEGAFYPLPEDADWIARGYEPVAQATMGCPWVASIFFVLALLWFAWRFKGSFETNAFKLPLSGGKYKEAKRAIGMIAAQRGRWYRMVTRDPASR